MAESSCKDTVITGIFNKLIADGDDSLSGAIITSNSNFEKYGVLNVYINGTMNDEYEFYCSDGDYCNITCQSLDACSNMNLYCLGDCWVDCGNDYDNITCPEIFSPNHTFNTNGCENIDGGRWELVRHVGINNNAWHPSTDDCSGSDVYGTYDYNAQSLNE